MIKIYTQSFDYFINIKYEPFTNLVIFALKCPQ